MTLAQAPEAEYDDLFADALDGVARMLGVEVVIDDQGHFITWTHNGVRCLLRILPSGAHHAYVDPTTCRSQKAAEEAHGQAEVNCRLRLPESMQYELGDTRWLGWSSEEHDLVPALARVCELAAKAEGERRGPTERQVIVSGPCRVAAFAWSVDECIRSAGLRMSSDMEIRLNKLADKIAAHVSCTPGTDTDKVLFVDIDGVLVVPGSVEDSKRGVEQLKRVCRETGCRLVMSSAWRTQNPKNVVDHKHAQRSLHERIGYDGPDFVDATPDFSNIGGPRGLEIASWLARQPEGVATWAVVDDDYVDIADHRFVQTNVRIGLDEVAADQLIAILNAGAHGRTTGRAPLERAVEDALVEESWAEVAVTSELLDSHMVVVTVEDLLIELIGWRPGMEAATKSGLETELVVSLDGDEAILSGGARSQARPCLDSHLNWGVWLGWVAEFGDVAVALTDGQWEVRIEDIATVRNASLALAIFGASVLAARHHDSPLPEMCNQWVNAARRVADAGRRQGSKRHD